MKKQRIIPAALAVLAVSLSGCGADSTARSAPTASHSASSTTSARPTATRTSAIATPTDPRYGQYGGSANSPGAGAYAGWSAQEQEDAKTFAVDTMRVYAQKVDAQTWHEYMDPRVTDTYKQQLARYNPAYNPVNQVNEAVYTEFSSDPTQGVVRVDTDAGVYVVHLARTGHGQAPKVSLIEPLSLSRR